MLYKSPAKSGCSMRRNDVHFITNADFKKT